MFYWCFIVLVIEKKIKKKMMGIKIKDGTTTFPNHSFYKKSNKTTQRAAHTTFSNIFHGWYDTRTNSNTTSQYRGRKKRTNWW